MKQTQCQWKNFIFEILNKNKYASETGIFFYNILSHIRKILALYSAQVANYRNDFHESWWLPIKGLEAKQSATPRAGAEVNPIGSLQEFNNFERHSCHSDGTMLKEQLKNPKQVLISHLLLFHYGWHPLGEQWDIPRHRRNIWRKWA